MKEFKGTRGEWSKGWGEGLTGPTTPRTSPIVDEGREYTPIANGKETIAIVIKQENDSFEELEANAKLIAAAPELLKALQKLIYFNERTFTGMGQDYTKMISKAEEAINKALN